MIPNRPKKTTSASGGFELLQMISEPNIEDWVSKGVNCEISHWLERENV